MRISATCPTRRLPPPPAANHPTYRVAGFGGLSHATDSDGQLDAAADLIAARWKRGLHQYIFFLNDHCGHGPKNVKTLMEKVQAKIPAAGKGLAPGWKPVKAVEKGGAGSIQGMFAKAKTKTKSAERQPKPAPTATHPTPAAATGATATRPATVKTSPASAVAPAVASAPAPAETNAVVYAATPPAAGRAAPAQSQHSHSTVTAPVGFAAVPSPPLDRASPDQVVKGVCGVGDTAQGWQCSACTFLNLKPLATICEMCQSSKPAGLAEPDVLVGSTVTTPTGKPTQRKRPSADLSQTRPTPIKKSRSESSPASKSRSQPTGKGSIDIMKFFGKK